MEKGLSNSFYIKTFTIVSFALVIFSLYNVYQISALSSEVKKTIKNSEELSKPPKIELISIKNSNCKECFDISSVINSIKKARYDITKESNLNLDSKEAQKLIERYKIDKLPALIILGEISKTNIKGIETRDDALVFTQIKPPYTEAATGAIIGRVTATILKDSSCEKCVDPELWVNEIKKNEISIAFEKTLDSKTSEGKELIEKYSIQMLPTVIFSKDLAVYGGEIIKNWPRIGSVEEDGSFVTRIRQPPYINLSTDEVEGIITLTILKDASCKECYDAAAFHKPILSRFGLVIGEEKILDIASTGKELVKKYNVTKIPTILLDGDLDLYPYLARIWEDVGTIEPDNTYVLRAVEVAKMPYKDLSNNTIVKP